MVRFEVETLLVAQLLLAVIGSVFLLIFIILINIHDLVVLRWESWVALVELRPLGCLPDFLQHRFVLVVVIGLAVNILDGTRNLRRIV